MEKSLGVYFGYSVIGMRRAELCHHGILGQRWGVRRTPEQLGHKVANMARRVRDNETVYRAKLTNITKNKSADPNDMKRFKYRNQSLARRVGGIAARVTAQMLIGDMLTGKISNYGSMPKGELAKKLGSIAKATAMNVALEDALAKSASKRYTDSGRKVKGAKDHLIQKEDQIAIGVGYAVRMAPFLNAALRIKASQAWAERERNEADFNRWAGRILEAPLADVVADADFKIIE